MLAVVSEGLVYRPSCFVSRLNWARRHRRDVRMAGRGDAASLNEFRAARAGNRNSPSAMRLIQEFVYPCALLASFSNYSSQAYSLRPNSLVS